MLTRLAARAGATGVSCGGLGLVASTLVALCRRSAERRAPRAEFASPGLTAALGAAGAVIVLKLLDKLGQDRLFVSDRGRRDGVLIDQFSP